MALCKFVPDDDLRRISYQGTLQLHSEAKLRLIEIIIELFVKAAAVHEIMADKCGVCTKA